MNKFVEATSVLHDHVENGDIKYRETITYGFENASQALRDVLSGKNFGKQVIRILNNSESFLRLQLGSGRIHWV